MKDSRRACGRGGSPAKPCSVPSASRCTATSGWTIRCSVRPWRLTSIVTESTRNGMSSLTISIDRVGRLPAVLRDRRVEHAHPRPAGLALAREAPVRQRRAVQVGHLPFGQVFGVDLAEVVRCECGERFGCVDGHLGADQLDNLVQPLGPALRFHAWLFFHACLQSGYRCLEPSSLMTSACARRSPARAAARAAGLQDGSSDAVPQSRQPARRYASSPDCGRRCSDRRSSLPVPRRAGSS